MCHWELTCTLLFYSYKTEDQIHKLSSDVIYVQLEKEYPAKSCLQSCLKPSTGVEYKQTMMLDLPNAHIKLSTMWKRMLVVPAACYLLLYQQDRFLAGLEKLTLNENIIAIGEGTVGSAGMLSPALGCSQQEGCFILQPSALTAGNAAFLQ